MIRSEPIRRGCLAVCTLVLTGCASQGNPWVRHERVASLRAAAADPARICDVIVENATDMYLDAFFDIEGRQRALGLLSPGQRTQFGVSCHIQKVEARASSSHGEAGGRASSFRKVARLDVFEPTRLRFTKADRVS